MKQITYCIACRVGGVGLADVGHAIKSIQENALLFGESDNSVVADMLESTGPLRLWQRVDNALKKTS